MKKYYFLVCYFNTWRYFYAVFIKNVSLQFVLSVLEKAGSALPR